MTTEQSVAERPISGRPYLDARVYGWDQMTLTATKTAASWAREFTKRTLLRWNAPRMVDESLLVVSELVTNAVEATGAPERVQGWTTLDEIKLVGVRILGLASTCVIEIWDSAPGSPVLQDDDPTAESGRGLVLVDNVAVRWGTEPTESGKVVWAEIPVYTSALPRRRRAKRPDVVPAARLDAELLQRVLDGLAKL